MRLLATKLSTTAACLIAILITTPIAHAGVFSFITDLFTSDNTSTEEPQNNLNSQNMALLQAAVNSDPNPSKSEGDMPVVEGTSLLAENGPTGSMADVKDNAGSDTISVYTVREGETLSQIAKSFNVSVNTILWANSNVKTNTTLKAGQTLIILPISGIKHTVKKGETLKGIANLYKGDLKEIMEYNNLSLGDPINVGDEIIIPDGEFSPPSPTKSTSSTKPKTSTSYSGPSYEGYYLRPVAVGKKTQGIHGHNGIDIGGAIPGKPGTPILAAADGIVIISSTTGWNGGYGHYIVVSHNNGTQTLYAHLSDNDVSVGDHVSKGQIIGNMGATGKATGVHLHFEIRGAKNPF
ncbi:MAG: peptidoglycan DD-metalloendopeptidase family protein [Candidatus Paceibacterota bacterium]